jgi:hypothetical protein
MRSAHRWGKGRHGGTLLALCAAFGLTACEGEKKASTTSEGDSGISDKPAIDPSIAKAMAAASARRGAGPAANNQGGPPSGGVFEPGAADKEMPRGAAPRITLGSEGTEPRVQLGAMQPKPGFKRNMTVQLLMRSGRQGMPPLDFAFTLQAQKPKAAAPAGAEGAQPAPAPAAAATDQVSVSATVQSVRVAPSQAMGIPKELEQELAALKGSKVDFTIQPNGAGDGFRYTLSKTADPGLENALRTFAETLATVTLPYPNKPVGKDAFWMATSRESAIGVDVVAYRMVKVESVDGDKVKLSINTKRYAVDKTFDLPELPKDTKFTLDEFQSVGEGKYEVSKDVPFPMSGELTLQLLAALIPENQPDQRAQVESRTRAAFNLSK